MTPQMLRANYSDLFGSSMLPVLEELFRSEYEQAPMVRDQLFKTVQTDRDVWQYSELHDLELFNQLAEGEEYSFVSPNQGLDRTINVKKYGLGVSLSEELMKDGKVDLLVDAVRKLGRSGRESKEVEAMKIFNNGFTTQTTPDGQPLFDTAHTLPSGLTFRNELSTAADLSPTSLRQAITDFETQFIGDSGIYERIAPKILLVHSSNRAYAQELIGSNLKPDTTDNNMNSLGQEGLMVVSSPRLSDEDAWFLLADAPDTGLRIVNREDMMTKAAAPDSVGFFTDSLYYKSAYREAIDAVHAKGVFGSPGA